MIKIERMDCLVFKMPSHSAPGLWALGRGETRIREQGPWSGKVQRVFPFTRQRRSTEPAAGDTEQRTFVAAGDLPAIKSCAPFGYMDHL